MNVPFPWLRIARVAALAAVCALPAQAQTPPQTAATTPGAEAGQPDAARDAVMNALIGSRESLSALNAYLTGGGATPQEVSRRTSQLIRDLSRQRGVTGSEDLLRAIQRVTSLAVRRVARAEIVQLAVENNFRPRDGAVAFDFGPPDASVQEGFERVVPGDPRVKGRALSGLRRPADDVLLSDGLSGVESIEVPVRNGSYRVVLMTQNLGDQKLSGLPFGAQIRINGVPILVGSSNPAEWRSEALLTSAAAQFAGAGDAGARARELLVRQQGGALVLEARSDQEKIVVEFIGFGDSSTYLTGMLIEPLDGESDLLLSEEARETLVPMDVRTALEAEIMAAAAEVLEQIAPPEAGQPDLLDPDLPEPEFETADVVSPS